MTRRRSRIDAMDLPVPAALDAGPAVALNEPAPIVAPPEPCGPVRGADALLCPAHLLGSMPLGCTLDCELGGVLFHATTWRADYAQLRGAGAVVLTGGELGALAIGAAYGRVWPAHLADWLARKMGSPDYRITLADALGGYDPRAERVEPWTIGRTLDRLGVSLRGVRMES